MAREQLKTLTEPMYYLLLALIHPRHGYGIMQCITEMTENRVQVGAGTLYALLSRFEGVGIISQIVERDRKKIYQITPKGAEVLTEEFCRLNNMVENGRRFFDAGDTLLPIDYAKAGQGEEEESVTSAETRGEKAPEEAPVKETLKGEKEPGTGSGGAGEKEPEAGSGGSGEKEAKGKSGKKEQQEQEKSGKQGTRGGFRKGIFAT